MIYQEDIFVKIPVVASRKLLAAKIFYYTIGGVFSISILSIIFINDPNNVIGRLISLILIALLIWLLFIKKTYEIIGSLVLHNTEIHFITDKCVEIFKIKDLSQIHFEYLGYQGRGNLAFSFDSGFGNRLSFYYLDSKLSFDVLIETQHIVRLRQIINVWKSNNNKIKITNSLGINITL